MANSTLSSSVYVVAILLILSCTDAVEWSKFKTSSDLGFCRRHRHFSASLQSRYRVRHTSLAVSTWRDLPAFVGVLEASGRPDLLLVIIAFANGIFRVVIDDSDSLPHSRHTVSDAILPHITPLPLADSVLTMDKTTATLLLPGASFFLKVSFDPLRVDLFSVDSDIPRISLNSQHRLLVDNFTHQPTAEVPDHHTSTVATPSEEDSSLGDANPAHTEPIAEESPNAPPTDSQPDPSPSCDGCWSEDFQRHTDPKLRGPESVGMDISFPFANHIYGIPERTVNFSIGDTVDKLGQVISEPYRLYNLDVFEFELDKPLGLYGAVPFLYARNGKHSSGILWLNSAETYVDVIESATGKDTHWFSESGLVDTYIFPGPSPSDILKQYLFLTGKPAMPARFALGYHQCRWNYRDEEDVRAVDAGFDEHDIPYDVLWLDIEHTDGKRYFTWDKERFPDPTGLQEHLGKRGRKMVTIVDPHVKRDKKYSIHKLGLEKNLYVNKPDGSPYDGWCWPGSSSYFDFTSKRVREEFAGLFSQEHYPHFTKYLHTWNDMNEPSVFNGPEGTMPKDLVHENGVEHRHIHNIYGHYFMQASFEGVRKGHGGNDRPFILSRSFFAGSHRYGAIWTGDNTADWEHLASSVRMLLPIQITGMVFSGADVGGFFGNPSSELLARWYQVGAFQPFFRGHAHLDTNRREPWIFGEPYTNVIASAIRTRYSFIPYWYSLFAGLALGSEAGFGLSNAGPPMRPLWWEFGEEESDEVNKSEHEWLVGNALLCAPVMEEGATKHSVYFPGKGIWYDLFAPGEYGKRVGRNGHMTIDVSLERMVVYQRGGTIVPKQERRRRSTSAMGQDAYTLVVALNEKREAEGELYLDDGRTYNFESGRYSLRRFSYSGNELVVKEVSKHEGTRSGPVDEQNAVVERVVILGFGGSAPKVVKAGDRELDFEYNEKTEVLTLQRPGVVIGGTEWIIRITI